MTRASPGLESTTVPPDTEDPGAPTSTRTALVPAFVIAWSADEPHRVGEVGLLHAERMFLGRGAEENARPRVTFGRQRPGSFRPMGPLPSPTLSRRHLEIERYGDHVDVRRREDANLPMLVNGDLTRSARLVPNDIVEIQKALVLRYTLRPLEMPPLSHLPEPDGAFGEPDADAILGEGPRAWALRDLIAFAAKVAAHVLVCGESGAGKELVARALHAHSARSRGPFIARNAATLTPELIAAELFGNLGGFPNPGMRERAGLVGEAHGGTLMLDEIGELILEMQTSLLRVLDRLGEYHRLGEAFARRSDFRLICATNRPLSALKHDLLARLTVHVEVPTLDERRDDIPLLVRHIMLRLATTSPDTAGRFVQVGPSGRYEVNVDPALMTALLRHSYPTNVRELERILIRAMQETKSTTLVLPKELRARPTSPPPARVPSTPPPPADPAVARAEMEEVQALLDGFVPPREELKAALVAHGYNKSRVGALYGKDRHWVARLMLKYGLREEDE